MAADVVILKTAQEEFASIVDYLLEVSDGPAAARRFMDEFERQVELIAENPWIYGLSRLPELAARGYHTMPVNTSIALYKVVDDVVVIAHLFHQSQSYARLV